MTIEIIPTVVPKVFEEITAAKSRYGALSQQLHIDCADGVFADNRTWMPLNGEKLPESAQFMYEAHLMIENPLSVGLSFARAGAKRIIGHVEALQNAERASETFNMWQKAGAAEIGIAVLLDTPLQDLVPYASLCDFVHIMTIPTIGKQGAKFDERSIERVAEVHRRYPHMTISTDGGGSKDNIDDLARAGATRFCVGSALAKAKDVGREYSRLLKAAQGV